MNSFVGEDEDFRFHSGFNREIRKVKYGLWSKFLSVLEILCSGLTEEYLEEESEELVQKNCNITSGGNFYLF